MLARAARPFRLSSWFKSAGMLAMALAATGSMAQAPSPAYPTKPVRMVVPFPAGGPTDAMARALAQKLEERMGQPVVIENRAGANGSIGAESVARSAPDGYTLLLSSAGVVTVNPAISQVRFDTMKDFAPVALATTLPSVMVVPPSLGVKNVQDFIKLARSKPGQLNYGSSGVGSASHLAMELFDRAVKINVNHIPYKGAAPAVTDLVAGTLQVMLIGSSTVLPFINAGRVSALGVSSLQRSQLLPNVPTIAEQNMAGFEVSNWFGIFAPARTPPAVVARLNTEINAIMKMQETRDKLAKDGFEPVEANTPQQFTSYVQSEIAKWARVVKDANITSN